MASAIVQTKIIKKFPESALETEINNFLNANPTLMVLSIETFVAVGGAEYIAVITYQIPD